MLGKFVSFWAPGRQICLILRPGEANLSHFGPRGDKFASFRAPAKLSKLPPNLRMPQNCRLGKEVLFSFCLRGALPPRGNMLVFAPRALPCSGGALSGEKWRRAAFATRACDEVASVSERDQHNTLWAFLLTVLWTIFLLNPFLDCEGAPLTRCGSAASQLNAVCMRSDRIGRRATNQIKHFLIIDMQG